MSFLLETGQELELESGKKLLVQRFIGSGGQGEVYEVKVGNEYFALKWYFDSQATSEQLDNIKRLISSGKPSSSFLWPIDIAHDSGSKSFGYIMGLRGPEYKSLFDLMKGRSNPGFATLATATFNLVDSFQKLHGLGLCYRDISHGNIFFHEESGDVLICDNDNVGLNNSPSRGVVGTPRFMAPEIVRAEAFPNSDSDLFSLATLLFYMLFISHPLEGKNEADIRCFDQPAMNQIYGVNPVFIFDPENKTNRPVPGYHKNALAYWEVYPDFLKAIFIRAFTTGIDPAKRVRGSEWKEVLAQLKDSIIPCICGVENFAQYNKQPINCWNCRNIVSDIRLEFPRKFVTIHSQTKLYGHHIDPSQNYDFSEVTAQIAQHPQDPTILGLKNLSNNTWQAFPLNGEMQPIDKERSVVIKPNTRIHFGKIEATIV